MLNRFRKNRKAKQELEAKQEVTQEMDDVLDTTPDEIDTEYAPEVDVEEVELEPLEEDEDDEYISDEEWEKMSPEEKAEFEDEDEDDEDGEDDDDYISDEEWEKMTPAERKAWEDEESPELGEGDDDTEYIMNDPEMVGYDDKEQQRDIYDFATEELEGEESVLDFGCGRGDLHEFLYQKDGETPKYKGVDINSPLINAGIKKYAPDITIENKDWFDLDSSYKSDWCVNIGSLCTRYDSSSEDGFKLVTSTLDKMMDLCDTGSVLILFSTHMPEEAKEKEFLLVDPGKILTYALNKYGLDTGNVILDHSYTDAIFKLTVLK